MSLTKFVLDTGGSGGIKRGGIEMMNIDTLNVTEEFARNSMISKTYIWWLVFNGPGYDDEWVAKVHNCPYCNHSGYNNGLFSHFGYKHPDEDDVDKLEQIYRRLQAMDIEFERYRREDIDEVIRFFSNEYDLGETLCMDY